MSPIQQMLLGVGAVATKTYVDDVFSTYLYTGTGSARSINNGINMSESGGMTWIKKRDQSGYSNLYDTTRGVTKYLVSNESDAEATVAQGLTAFNNNGFSLGTSGFVNTSNGDTYASWTFRKTPGFFDVVTYTGNATTRSISHSLGSVPGLILIKDLTSAHDWVVYHRSMGNGSFGKLNTTDSFWTGNDIWNSTSPTSTNFTINGNNSFINTNTNSYIAYVFAGGESTAATARSVDFDGTTDALQLAASDDFAYGSQFDDFTIECWVYPDDFPNQKYIFDHGQDNSYLHYNSGKLAFYNSTVGWQGSLGDCGTLEKGQWSHIAVVRHSGYTKVYVNGTERGSQSDSFSYGNYALTIGHFGNIVGNTSWDGKISNFRVVKGTAVYTSSFRPPTEPLTSITNTVLLCCNNSSTTGKTTGGTITAHNNVSASTDSPFDDPAGFKFGDAGDQNIIKCGSYVGNGNADGPEINLGWEPQWVLTKSSSGSYNWQMYDSMRGIVTGGNDPWLEPNTSDAEASSLNWLDLTSRGFKITESLNAVNKSGDTYIYIAIRRPDGYVGKPPELGTGVFAMDTGNGSTTTPTFDSGFPVDFVTMRQFASSGNLPVSSRLTGGALLKTNTTDAETSPIASWTFDSNVGWSKGGADNTWISWMWKRHAGFDCICYDGQTELIKDERHSLNAVPEMIWVKARTGAYAGSSNWYVYHKGLNGGTNPHTYYLELNTNAAESSGGTQYWQRPPTSTHFSHGNTGGTGYTGWTYIAMLFASVDGISKVGYYTGNGTSSSSTQTITTGFQPRFLIIRRTDAANWWIVLDTTRGWASGDDKYLQLNDSAAQADYEFGVPISTGFTLTGNNGAHNVNSGKYIYYCHA